MKGRGANRRVERLVSAGGVVHRVADGKIDIMLGGRGEPRRWTLPKGTPDLGESLEQTALREVQEETGLEVAIEQPLGNINYWFVAPESGVRCHKTVHFYLMSSSEGSTELHDKEYDQVRWFPSDEALKALTFANEAKVVEKALAAIRDGSWRA